MCAHAIMWKKDDKKKEQKDKEKTSGLQAIQRTIKHYIETVVHSHVILKSKNKQV